MYNVHPNLKKERFLIRFGVLVFSAAAILPLVSVFVVLQIVLPFDFLRTVGFFFALLFLSAGSLFLFRYFFKKYRINVENASALISHSRALKGIIQPGANISLWGPLFRINYEEGGHDIISLRVQKHGVKKMYSKSVEVYKADRKKDEPVVVKVDKSYMIGKLYTYKSAQDISSEFHKARKWLSIIIVSIILVMAAAQVFHYFSVKSEAEFAAKTKGWPTISARVISSELRDVRIKQGKTHVKGYEADIKYEYSIGGRNFLSSRIHPAYEAGTNFEHHDWYVNKYPAGSTHFVYYNPEDYSFSLLEAGHEEDILEEIDEIYVVTVSVSGLLISIMIILIIVFRAQEKSAVKFFGSR